MKMMKIMAMKTKTKRRKKRKTRDKLGGRMQATGRKRWLHRRQKTAKMTCFDTSIFPILILPIT